MAASRRKEVVRHLSEDQLDEALDELVTEGMVVEKEVETREGTTTYYRLNTGDARE